MPRIKGREMPPQSVGRSCAILHARRCRQVEQNLSNVVALFARPRSSLSSDPSERSGVIISHGHFTADRMRFNSRTNG
jgi:hypothetical protein